nr:acetyl-CoA carboxylase carboxyltransferase subunit alpha [uncultured Blautia sp.]
MKLENMFKKTKIISRIQSHSSVHGPRPEVPEGLLRKCNKCGAAIIAEEVKRDGYICPKCGGYFRVHAYRRIQMVADPDTFEEWDHDLTGGNPMHYRGYEEKVHALQEKTGLQEAVVTGKCRINGKETVLAVCDGRFMMSSMGWAVGEKITRAVENATEKRLPVIIFACSGGARMQEGITSLMQMAKTSAALRRHSDAGLLYVSVLTEPTTGGVTASFAMLGDVILAEPGALIGFAGPRVIEQTIHQKLPKGFQRAEFLLEHGFIDDIVKRENLKETLGKILTFHEKGDLVPGQNQLECSHIGNAPFLSAWERVQLSRKMDRPSGSDYIEALFDDFTELHGDRTYGDDKAIIGGIASFHGMPVTVIAQQKGNNTKENIYHNFGMPMPEGYRKALRLMKQAEKFHRPVICFVDTPGAFCGVEAEERGQGEAIARNLMELSGLKIPVLSIVTGEGGSGGALALAAGDQVWMLENSVYSVLSPEGFASILWKDSTRAEEAAEVMKLTATDLYQKGIIEEMIPEPEEFHTESLWQVTGILDGKIEEFIKEYDKLSENELLNRRYERFRKF